MKEVTAKRSCGMVLGAMKLKVRLQLVAALVQGAQKKEVWKLCLAHCSKELTLWPSSCLALPQRAHFFSYMLHMAMHNLIFSSQGLSPSPTDAVSFLCSHSSLPCLNWHSLVHAQYVSIK